jgi:hypothetical protein
MRAKCQLCFPGTKGLERAEQLRGAIGALCLLE